MWSGRMTTALATLIFLSLITVSHARPNIVLILADDLGYGDVGCYGAKAIPTPNIDRIAAEGIRFTRCYAPASTCTPTRYALMTGDYGWRQKARTTTILDGDAPLAIDVGRSTLPQVLRLAGYRTALVGKWHLGIGNGVAPVDFNGAVAPGPLEVGFDEAFYIPATVDRVPCVFIEDHSVHAIDPHDPIAISYRNRIGDLPVGRERPDLLKYRGDDQHSDSIVNGISRIGYMQGGVAAHWVDEQITDELVARSARFIRQNREQPFFLLLGAHDPHVPHAPHARFKDSSRNGLRGDAIVQFDWLVGRVMQVVRDAGLEEHTIVIVTSDNGPTVFDGYYDGSQAALGEHRPAGRLRGGKYSAFEGGCRVPFLIRWPKTIRPGVSDELLSLVDLLPSLARIAAIDRLPADVGRDGIDVSAALIDATASSPRRGVVLQGIFNTLAIIQDDWKLIPKNQDRIAEDGGRGADLADDRFRNARVDSDQLYHLVDDPGEIRNLIDDQPEIAASLRAGLQTAVDRPQ